MAQAYMRSGRDEHRAPTTQEDLEVIVEDLILALEELTKRLSELSAEVEEIKESAKPPAQVRENKRSASRGATPQG